MATRTIPLELIFDILLKLPLKSLIRCRLVCKTWENLINNSESFAKLHLSNSRNSTSTTHTQSLVVGGYRCLYFVDDIDNSSNDPLIKLTWPSFKWCGNIDVIGSCNGLVCLFSPPHFWCICNPWTRDIRQIVNCPGFTRNGYFGFGYDSHNDDYKILVIEACDDNGQLVWTNFFLYRLKAKSWRKLLFHNVTYESQPGATDKCDRSGNGYFVNDWLHWIARDRRTRETCIARFNVCTEVWDTEFRIDSIVDINRKLGHLGIVDGSLALTIRTHDTGVNDHRYSVWIMKEYGIDESWSFKNYLHVMFSNYIPVAYSKKGSRALCHKTAGNFHLYWYNYKYDNDKCFEVDEEINTSKVIRIPWLCEGTLVPVLGSTGRLKVASCMNEYILMSDLNQYSAVL